MHSQVNMHHYRLIVLPLYTWKEEEQDVGAQNVGEVKPKVECVGESH